MIMVGNKKTLYSLHGRTIKDLFLSMGALKEYSSYLGAATWKKRSAMNKTQTVFRSSIYLERTEKTHSQKRKNRAGATNEKWACRKKEGRTIGVALMKQKRRKRCLEKNMDIVHFLLNFILPWPWSWYSWIWEQSSDQWKASYKGHKVESYNQQCSNTINWYIN